MLIVVTVEKNINEVVERGYCKVDDNLIKRTTSARFTTEPESDRLLGLYALVWAVDKLRYLEGTCSYDNLFFKLRQIV